MLKARRLKRKVKHYHHHKIRRTLHLYQLKRRIADRRRVGFVVLEQQC